MCDLNDSPFLKGVTFAAEEGENGASGSPVSMEMDNENSRSSVLVIEPSEEGGNEEEEEDEGEEENDVVVSLIGSKLFGFFIADDGSRSIWVDSIQLTPPHDGKSYERGIPSCSSTAKHFLEACNGCSTLFSDLQVFRPPNKLGFLMQVDVDKVFRPGLLPKQNPSKR